MSQSPLSTAPTPSSGGSIAILYDVAYPFVEGGGQRRLFEIATRLAQRGWCVDWYALQTWEGESVLHMHGITYHGLKGDTVLYNAIGKRRVREAMSYGRAILFANISFGRFDIVWCGQWPYFHLLALLLRLVPWRTRLVVDWWEIWGSHWFDYRRLVGLGGWLAESVLANMVTRIGHAVTISMLGLNQMRALGAPRKNLHYISNGIDLHAFAQIPVAEGRADLIYFGRLKDHKNVDHLVRALALLKGKGLHLTCDIVGDGPEHKPLTVLAAQLGVTGQITFHGAVDDNRLVALLKRAQIFVHPSTKEGGGSITLLEANACGLPVVCYDHPRGIDPGQMLQNETGLLVSRVDAESLANGIARMLTLCEKESIREKCIAHAAAFGWDAVATQYEELFGRLLSVKMAENLSRKT